MKDTSIQSMADAEMEELVLSIVVPDMWQGVLRKSKNSELAGVAPVRKLFGEGFMVYVVPLLTMRVARAYQHCLHDLVFVGVKGRGQLIAESAAQFFYAANRIPVPLAMLDVEKPDLVQAADEPVLPLAGKTIIVWSDLYENTTTQAAYEVLLREGPREVVFAVLVDGSMYQPQPELFQPKIFRAARAESRPGEALNPDEEVLVLLKEAGDGESSVWIVRQEAA